MSEPSEDRELTALETALRELRPQPESLDRAVLMYRAGRAAAHTWPWPLATLTATTLALVLGILLLLRPSPPVVMQVVYLPAPESSEVASGGHQPPVGEEEPGADAPRSPDVVEALALDPLDASARRRYLQMQERVLRWGLDGIPPPPPAPPLPAPPTVEQLLRFP